jgi:hypothetical protein
MMRLRADLTIGGQLISGREIALRPFARRLPGKAGIAWKTSSIG